MELLPFDNQYIFKGNIIPKEWYRKFANSRGKADLPLMSVLSEIVYWYRPKEVKDPETGKISYMPKFPEDVWQTSYAHFEKEFGFNREKTRKALVKLEAMGIIKREFRTVTLRGQNYNNRLFIHLNKGSLWLNEGENTKDHDGSEDGSEKPLFKVKNSDCSQAPSFPSPLLPGIDKNIEENIKNRSRSADEIVSKSGEPKDCQDESVSESNFCQNSFDEVKTLQDFYPLSQEDCQLLQSLSRRQFSFKAMNEILSDMAKRLVDRFFKSKKAFLNYMTKVFTYEKRQPKQVNNDNFRIRNNMSEDEIDFEEREKYLTEIEYSLQVSPETHFKKRMAAVLPQKTAYNLLKAYKSVYVKEGEFTLILDKHVELSEPDKKIILAQAQSTHEKVDFNDTRLRFIKDLRIIMPEKPAANVSHNPHKPQLPDNVWGTVRCKLIDVIHEGKWIDLNWFSKLEASIDEDSRKLTLKAPSNFVKDWIQENYLDQIQQVCKTENYQLEGVKI